MTSFMNSPLLGAKTTQGTVLTDLSGGTTSGKSHSQAGSAVNDLWWFFIDSNFWHGSGHIAQYKAIPGRPGSHKAWSRE